MQQVRLSFFLKDWYLSDVSMLPLITLIGTLNDSTKNNALLQC